jgi:hypothetical protein
MVPSDDLTGLETVFVFGLMGLEGFFVFVSWEEEKHNPMMV